LKTFGILQSNKYNSMKFRVPRKIRKKIGKKIYLYPPDKDGNSLMAKPLENQRDYTAFLQGILRTPFHFTKAEQKQMSIEWNAKFNKVVEISDEELLEAVNNIFGEDYRDNAYNVLLRAKSHPIAISDYYTFVNAWGLIQNGERYGNVACMCIDSAEDNLKRSKPRKRK